MARPFIARYPSDCSDCEEQISPGDEIVSVGPGEFEHVDCSAARAKRPERAVICTLCHLARPCEHDDDSPEWTL